MSSINIKRDLPKEFLGDILVTAFDGAYGGSWYWSYPSGRFAFRSETPAGTNDASASIWTSVTIRIDDDSQTGEPKWDNVEHVIDHDVIAKGIERIVNDDYEGAFRPATDEEVEDWKKNGTPRGRNYRLVAGKGLMVDTGETARAYREDLASCLSATEPDAGDIDSNIADAIVQAGLFGKVIFG